MRARTKTETNKNTSLPCPPRFLPKEEAPETGNLIALNAFSRDYFQVLFSVLPRSSGQSPAPTHPPTHPRGSLLGFAVQVFIILMFMPDFHMHGLLCTYF